MKLPEIKVDTKVVIALAVVSLVISYVVYAENKRLKNEISSTTVKRPCGCKDKTSEVVIPLAEDVVTHYATSSVKSSAVSPTHYLEEKANPGPHDTIII